MVNCSICGKGSGEVLLFNGIFEGKLVKICRNCSAMSDAVIINKPTDEQLQELDRKRSVKEVMQDLSSPGRKIATKDNIIAHKDLARLRFPTAKQESQDLVSNYDWVLKQARRHRKLSTAQVAEATGLNKAKIEELENGQITPGFEKTAIALEDLYDVKVLLDRENSNFPKNQEDFQKKEKEILAGVEEKMKKHRFLIENRNKNQELGEQAETKFEQIDIDEIIKDKEAHKKQFQEESLDEKIEQGKFDFSDKEDLDKITIQDLVERKSSRK